MKRGILITVVIVAALVVGCLVTIKLGTRRLRLEDEVPHRFTPVLKAIFNFEDSNGVSPQALSDLVPQFIEVVPTSESIHKVDYTCEPDGTNWLLTVTCQVGQDKRMYCWRTDNSISWPDGWIESGWLHGWHILKNEEE